MKITELVNKIFTGENLDDWFNDETFPLSELKKTGHPYSLACVQLNENSLIAVDTQNIRQREFIENNQNTDFVLDASVFPRKIQTSTFGLKNVFFAKKFVQDEYRLSGLRNQFIINAFKENDLIAGAPMNGRFAGIEKDDAFSDIRKKINQLKEETDLSKYKSSEIGSLFIKVDFLEKDPYFKTELISSGFSFSEIEMIINSIRQSTL